MVIKKILNQKDTCHVLKGGADDLPVEWYCHFTTIFLLIHPIFGLDCPKDFYSFGVSQKLRFFSKIAIVVVKVLCYKSKVSGSIPDGFTGIFH